MVILGIKLTEKQPEPTETTWRDHSRDSL